MSLAIVMYVSLKLSFVGSTPGHIIPNLMEEEYDIVSLSLSLSLIAVKQS